MGVKNLFISKAEKQRQQALHDRIRYLRGTFPENSRIPTCNPQPNKTEELQREADLLQDARDLLEAQRTTTLPHARTVPSYIVELDASQTVPAGTLPHRPTTEPLTDATPTTIATTTVTTVTTVISNHLDLDLGILGLKTLHLYTCAALGLSCLLIAQLGTISIKALEILSAVLTDSAVVRGLTLVGLGAVVAGGFAVAHVNHSNNARRVAEVGIRAQQARDRVLESVDWDARADGRRAGLMLEDKRSQPAAAAAFPRGQREPVWENVRARE